MTVACIRLYKFCTKLLFWYFVSSSLCGKLLKIILRAFNPDWTESYVFILPKGSSKPVCLICSVVIILTKHTHSNCACCNSLCEHFLLFFVIYLCYVSCFLCFRSTLWPGLTHIGPQYSPINTFPHIWDLRAPCQNLHQTDCFQQPGEKTAGESTPEQSHSPGWYQPQSTK